jgi:hypothetical protein
MQPASLYFVSTPLHLFASCGIALHNRDTETPSICFIDQAPSSEESPYAASLRQWPDSPFACIEVFTGKITQVLAKYRLRRANFRRLAALVSQTQPTRLYTGNDRRIEFQYAMHQARRLRPEATGIYMDEGTFTYVGRPRSSSVSDRRIDSSLKKLLYGRWWKHPPTVGASEWIQTAYVAFPELAHPLIQQKQLVHLAADYFKSAAIKSLAQLVLRQFGVSDANYADFDLVLTLPHASILREIAGYETTLHGLCQQLSTQQLKIAVKYHPGEPEQDVLGLSKYPGVHLLPARLSFEFILPLLGSPLVVGDVSSTLLTARWLRPDLRVVSFKTTNNQHFENFARLYGQLDIDIIEKPDALLKLYFS